MRIFRTTLFPALLLSAVVSAQTNPVPQALPYTQNFSSLAHTSTVYPAGWQGWETGAVPGTTYNTSGPTANRALVASGNASTNTGDVFNYNGKVGFLNTGTLDIAIALSINTMGRRDVQVSYGIMTMRNPFNGFLNLNITSVSPQYRVGHAGAWVTVAGQEYVNNTTQQTTGVTTPQKPETRTFTLPAICDAQPEVQIRWVARQVNGIGSRPSFAIDDVSITGPCTTPVIAYPASPYCADMGIAVVEATRLGNGTFSATGLTIDPISGSVTLASSGAGGTVYYTKPAVNGCPQVVATAAIIIAQPALSHAGGPYVASNMEAVGITAATSGTGTWSGGLGVFANATDAATTYTPHASEWGSAITISWTTADPDGTGPCGTKTSTAIVQMAVQHGMFQSGNGRGEASITLPLSPLANAAFRSANGRGEASAALLITPIASRMFFSGNGRGEMASVVTITPVPTSMYRSGNGRGEMNASFQPAPLAMNNHLGGVGRGEIATGVFPNQPIGLGVILKGLLDGPYVSASGLMSDGLRMLASFPLTEPYTALGYPHIAGGGETMSPTVLSVEGPNAIVDWVVVELRDPSDPATVKATRSALIQRDGDVVNTDGISPVRFPGMSGAHYIAIRHRNHLGVMSAVPIGPSNTLITVDLTAPSTLAYGTDARRVVGIRALLWAGDVNSDGVVKYTGLDNDRDPVLLAIGGTVPTNTIDGTYQGEDVNLDGRVLYTGANNDRDPILLSIGGVVPTAVRVGQLPE